MKLCIITNYTRGYINDSLILNSLLNTLDLTSKDIFNMLDINNTYYINDNYTHSLILLDYKVSSMHSHTQYFPEIKIPKIFIIDTVPQAHKNADITFSKELLNSSISALTCLTQDHQTLLYEKYADGFIFYSKLDVEIFNNFYNLSTSKPGIVIPPSLGDKSNIKTNFTNFSPNSNIGFNGALSYSNGLFSVFNALESSPHYHMNLYGEHGRNDISNEILANFITSNNPLVKFKGKLKNQNNFFKDHHIYSNTSIYDSFNYFTFVSILNGMVPILSENTGTSEYFPSYPFKAKQTPESICEILEKIKSTPVDELKSILTKSVFNLEGMNDEALKDEYHYFLNSI